MGLQIFPHFPVVSLAFLLVGIPFWASAAELTIYDHLRRHGLPIGLLPKGITESSFDAATGKFVVSLAQPCNAQFENQLHYDFNVSGTLSFAKISDLSGISAQELFLWFPVKGIRVDVPSSGLIHFDVGVIDKQFSLSSFDSPRDCTAADPQDQAVVDALFSRFDFENKFEEHEYESSQVNLLRSDS